MSENLIAQYRALIDGIRACAEDGYLPDALVALAASCEEHAAALESESVIDWEGAA